MDNDFRLALERAVQLGDFYSAQSLATKYGKAVQSALSSTEDPAIRKQILDDALNTFREQIHLARVMRSHIAARLQTMTGHHIYNPHQHHDYTWRVRV